jgi:histidinol-phosphatase (PHP family)
MEDMILRGIALGLHRMCFTEHMDMDFPATPDTPADFFLVNTDSYLYDLIRLKEKYAGQIELGFGIELGIQPHLSKELAGYVKSYDFDFVIASTHVSNGRDPYRTDFYLDRSEKEAYGEYFTSIHDGLKRFSNFDVCGHLDYVVRYGPNRDTNYCYADYRELIDPILSLLIEREKGLEINTGAIRYNLKELNPCTDILKRFRELGGEIITIGSDSHSTKAIAAGFTRTADLLKECGFRYYATFSHRMADFHPLT